MNRLNEIHLHSTPDQWNYVPTSQNPADFCTRFALFSKLKFHQSWLNAPTLLEQRVNSISADNESDKLLKIEEIYWQSCPSQSLVPEFCQMGSLFFNEKTCITYCISFKI